MCSKYHNWYPFQCVLFFFFFFLKVPLFTVTMNLFFFFKTGNSQLLFNDGHMFVFLPLITIKSAIDYFIWLMVSFLFLLIAAYIGLIRQQVAVKISIRFSISTTFILHLATHTGHAHFIIRYFVIDYVSVESRWKQRYTNWFRKESICAIWIICLEHSELLDQFCESQ